MTDSAYPPRFTAIVAMDAKRVIGDRGTLPWRLPGDLRFFKRTTTGHTVVMGRRTWISIGKPLPNRRNVVLSRSLSESPDGVDLVRSLDELDALALQGQVFVIGGAEIYEALLPRCQELLLTFVYGHHQGDTFLPPFETQFTLDEVLERTPEFEIRRYRRSSPTAVAGTPAH